MLLLKAQTVIHGLQMQVLQHILYRLLRKAAPRAVLFPTLAQDQGDLVAALVALVLQVPLVQMD
jgi:hypothetical protein